MKENQNIDLEITNSAKEYLAKVGFDPAFGARPLKRAIERELLNPLALKLLELPAQENTEQNKKIVVEKGKDGLEFK